MYIILIVIIIFQKLLFAIKLTKKMQLQCHIFWCAILFGSMAEPQRQGEVLPEDVGSDDCLTSYTHIYSPDLLK